jgi:glycerol kinase
MKLLKFSSCQVFLCFFFFWKALEYVLQAKLQAQYSSNRNCLIEMNNGPERDGRRRKRVKSVLTIAQVTRAIIRDLQEMQHCIASLSTDGGVTSNSFLLPRLEIVFVQVVRPVYLAPELL